MTPTPSEIALLVKLSSGHFHLRYGKATPAVQSMIDRGYCSTFKERHAGERPGMLGLLTGQINIQLTEAGRFALACLVIISELKNANQPKPTS